jgi:hypothetical protein
MMALGAALLSLSVVGVAACWLYRHSYEDED